MKTKDKIANRRVPASECGELNDKTVFINRVATVAKGGRRFSFNALVVTGDGQGNVGFGTGKANEVPDAIRKASESARKNIVKFPLRGTTIPHEVLAEFGPAKVVLKPAAPGTGVIAGSVARSVLEAAGIRDIRTKCIGSTSPNNTILAIMDGLLGLRSPEDIAAARGKTVDDIAYSPY